MDALAGVTFPAVVISQVYGGGGNSGATLKNDFIEIHNVGQTEVSIEGWSVQYASTAGSSWQVTALHNSLAPGQYAVVREAPGAGGTINVPADFSGTIPMAAGAGKVALVKSTTALSCGTSAAPCPGPEVIADFVGYGTGTSYFEGGGPTATLSNTKAAIRNPGVGGINSGCTDTDSNSADFVSGDPHPRSLDSTRVVCPETAPRVIGTSPRAAGELADPPALAVTFSEPVSLDAGWFSASCTVTGTHGGTASGGPQQFDVINSGDFAPGETCTATVHASLVHDHDATPKNMSADFSWIFKTEGSAIALPDTRISEIHYDNAGDDVDERIEIEGPANMDLSGWSVVLYNGNGGQMYDSRPLSGSIPATCEDRGVVVVPFASIQNGSPDGIALVHGNELVQFLSYEGAFSATDGPAMDQISLDIKIEEGSATAAVQSLQQNGKTGKWKLARRSFGRCNSSGPPDFDMTFTGRQPLADPPLPVGFEDQLFATMTDTSGAAISTTFTWSSDTPDLASIDQNGVMHALAAGQAVFRATASNGTSVTYSLPTTVATLGGTADYRGNTAFGAPTDGDASDDFIITRDQYTISYSHNRNTPNWVSYEFDVTHFQPADGTASIDRCDCFTHDPALPASFTHLTTADYTGAGAFAGYGIDRGHMARSFDFTSGTLDNARSYYLSNIIPQAAVVNQGPWKLLEDSLGNLARFHDKEVYVIDGVAGSKGTVKGVGKIVIPAAEWKVAVVLPRNHGLADVHDFNDIDDVIAVLMPNDPTIGADWQAYKTTVDEIERASGYDLLALLPDKLESSVENNLIFAAKALNAARDALQELATVASLNGGESNSLLAKISAAQQQLGSGNRTPARNQLKSALNELDAMVSSGRVTATDADALRTIIENVIASLGS
jgi:DNA/RNA endonuclease G (NUC1)